MCGMNLTSGDGTVRPYHIFNYSGGTAQIPKGYPCMCGLTKFGELGANNG